MFATLTMMTVLALHTATGAPPAADLPRRDSMFAEADAGPTASLTIHPSMAAHPGRPGSIAFFAASGATVRVEPAPGETVPVLTHGTQLASTARGKADPYRRGHWDVAMVANLSRRSAKGTVMMVVFDADEPRAIANNEVTALWSFVMPATRQFSVRVRLDDDAGFRPGRKYLFRAFQTFGKRERVLATGAVRLE